jgi:hypothetical protein
MGRPGGLCKPLGGRSREFPSLDLKEELMSFLRRLLGNSTGSKVDAAVNVIMYEKNGWIEWLRQGDRITGIWVKAFPDNTKKRDFLAMICASREDEDDDTYMKILSGAYTIEKSSRGEGFDICFR